MTNVFNKNPTEQFIDSVCQVSDKMVNNEKSLLISNLWAHFEETDECKLLYLMYNDTNYEEQCDLFSFLGSSLNENIYKRTTNNEKHSKDLSLEDLKTATKEKLYDECEGRLKNFIDCLTERKIHQMII